MALDKISHSKWRGLGKELPEEINHWPDRHQAIKADNENTEDPEQWLSRNSIGSYSLREIFITSGYPPPDPQEPGKWMRAHGLLPAWSWIASQHHTKNECRGLPAAKLISGALRYFEHVAGVISRETIKVSITPHFRHLCFNPLPLANLLEQLTLSFRGIPVDYYPQAGVKVIRSNDCYVDVELWVKEDKLIGVIKEGFLRFDGNTFPLDADSKPGSGMQSIMNYARACGITTLLFTARAVDAEEKRTVQVDCVNKSTSDITPARCIDLAEDEVVIEFEFSIGDRHVGS
jgi:hypothetical protein